MTGSSNGNTRISSDMRHNQNCYAYLCQLLPLVTEDIIDLLPGLIELDKLEQQYDPDFAYGDLYSRTVAYLESNIDSIYKNRTPSQITALDNLIYAIYFNDNHILENADWINQIATKTRPRQVNTGNKIAKALTDHPIAINKVSPMKMESWLSRAMTLFTPNFKPQHGTNLPSIKHFSYNKDSSNIEFRFGTQAQRHNGSVRISPLFKHWLRIHAQKYPAEQSICYIYFNNLSLDADNPFDIPRNNEQAFSLALHNQESNPDYKTAVITLPASQALMGANHYQKTDKKLAYQDVFDELLAVAEGNRHKSGISDFRISAKIRKILFSTRTNQNLALKSMLQHSFHTMGINEKDSLSTAQKQAVWLHFVKFELTDFIISKLTANNQNIGYNFSCRDAIDRGALSSIYYNLMKSFELDNPIQKDEFEQCLDVAAANVKGRGMNFHRQIIWNALDTYINANHDSLFNDSRKSWLIYWRDMNCPHSRVDELINLRIRQCMQQFHQLPPEQHHLKSTGLALLTQASQQHQMKVNGQRLILEVISRTSQLLSCQPNPQAIQAYKNLAKELKINDPTLHVIGGTMEILLGLILYIPSFGYSQALMEHGFSLAQTGFFHVERQQMREEMNELSVKLSNSCLGL